MKFEAFENEVKSVVENLPEEYVNILKKEEIEIIPREYVPKAVRKRYRNNIVFGMFIGVPKNRKRTFSYQTEPTRIEIYKESFERVYGTVLTKDMKSHIFKTVVHEIAHYFGFDEKEVRDRGY